MARRIVAQRSALFHHLLRHRGHQLSARPTCRRRCDRLEAPYIPLVVQEAAGLPLDPTFAEQKKIMARCNGTFFRAAMGPRHVASTGC